MITSTQNPRIKHLLQLQQKSSLRKEEGLFVVEGRREVEHCLEAGFKIRTAFVCEEIGDADPPHSSLKVGEIERVSPNVYERIAYRGGTEGIVAVVEARQTSLSDLQLSASPLIVVLESVEKPGNLGAVLRSADAAGADAVVVCDPLTDLYNPNLIRSSIGALFTVPCVACSTEECIAFFREKAAPGRREKAMSGDLTPVCADSALLFCIERAYLCNKEFRTRLFNTKNKTLCYRLSPTSFNSSAPTSPEPASSRCV